MDITFSAANTAGLNNPGTEIITLVKDESGNFINPPSYDKMRAYLRSGEVPMLFVTDAAGETGSLYQLDDYSETENKIRFSNNANTIEFSAGADTPVVSDVIPKPLTYDYMPEGYPKKSVQTVTLMEEQELAFALEGEAVYAAYPTEAFEIVEGQTYTVKWDGTEYECVCVVFRATILALGNKSIFGTGDDTGEPFLYLTTGAFATHETAASHTISVTTVGETVTPMTEEFLPVASEDNYGVVKKSEIVTAYKFNSTAPHDQMVKAIAEFRDGRASIMWNGRLISSAEHDPSTDKIAVTFAKSPYRINIKKNIDGYYNFSTGTSEFSELETNTVRLHDTSTNNQNDNCPLTAEGTSSDMTLKIGAKHLSLDNFEILNQKELYLESSTTDSTKKFKITVDDSGTISATEVV